MLHASPFVSFLFFCLLLRLPLRSTLFPYTTLFRSNLGWELALLSWGLLVIVGIIFWFIMSIKEPPTIDEPIVETEVATERDRKSTRLNSSHVAISYAVFCLKKKKKTINK